MRYDFRSFGIKKTSTFQEEMGLWPQKRGFVRQRTLDGGPRAIRSVIRNLWRRPRTSRGGQRIVRRSPPAIRRKHEPSGDVPESSVEGNGLLAEGNGSSIEVPEASGESTDHPDKPPNPPEGFTDNAAWKHPGFGLYLSTIGRANRGVAGRHR